MKIRIYFIAIFFILFGVNSCQTDDSIAQQPFVIAFEKQSYDFSKIPDVQEIKLVFSEEAKANGSVVVRITPTESAYGVDFSTIPAAQNNNVEIPFQAGQKTISFVFKNHIFPFDSDTKAIGLEVIQINYTYATSIQGYTRSVISFERSIGAVLLPEVGGPNQGDQVFIDLSTEEITKARRDSWDLGFYGGNKSRVTINGSLYMAVKQLEITNIDAVTPASVQQYQASVAVGTFDPVNENYIDHPNGHIDQTAIAEISDNPEDNKVYLVNMGYTVGSSTPPVGSVAVAGDARGWKKIRILKEGDGYLLQFADLNSNTHEEIIITKNDAYNFTFFSLATKNIVAVEPEKAKWDLSFTVFTNIIDGAGSYGYSDFVLSNLKAGVKLYRVSTSLKAFADYKFSDVNEASFVDDQRVIGADWRDVFTGGAYTDRYYIIKDIDNNYYKIRMLGFLNDSGVRGYPKFEYQLLQ